MKAMTLIPKKIKQKYGIEEYEDKISVHKPAYVNIDFDEEFRIENDSIAIDIINSKCHISLWKKTFMMHITIFK